MPRYILKLTKGKDFRYVVWSTIVDAPVSPGFKTVDELAQDLEERGDYNRDFPQRVERADQNGCSAFNYNLHDIVSYNRAGPNESCLTLAQLTDLVFSE